MNQQQTGLAFASLGVASLAVAGSCLVYIDTLGSLSYLGATLAVFLAMLCATRFSALHRTAVAARPQPAAKPVVKAARRETSRMRAREDSEDEVIESRMAALHAAVEVEDDAPSTLPPQHFETASFFAPPEIAPGSSSVVVTEEPLDPALARQFAEFRPELAVQMDVPNPVTLRQMDDIRAQIARLREESRVRHAANAARAKVVAPVAVAAPAHAMVPNEAARPDSAAGTDPFARTEFSGLPGEPRANFARTEFLTPVELPR